MTTRPTGPARARSATQAKARTLPARQSPAAYRVNARLDHAQAGKLAYLAELTGQSTSDVMREAVDRYYEQMKAEAGCGKRILESLIGTAKEGLPEDLSANYKTILNASLIKKHGHR
ncbi:MAG TPA: ribbon-helix-helix domain-containing protein [Usitatibacteraceae bacterium]|nr:ribbon-helix-helix domain-containing protein [Usitatibacteraceae bacterium]